MKLKSLLFFCTGILILTDLCAKDMTEEQLRQAISENRLRACGGYCPYEAPQIKDSKAPAGFKAFYVSHLGRHGCRYHSKPDDVFGKVMPCFESLKKEKLLTASGDSLFTELKLIDELTHGGSAKSYANIGLLTQKGSAEHKGIGERLASRYPSVFKDKSRNKVNCYSTTSQRAIQSMANFATAVKGRHPAVEVTYNLDLRHSVFSMEDSLVNFISTEEASLKIAENEFIRTHLDHNPVLDVFASRMFTDPAKVNRTTGNIYSFLNDIYTIAMDAAGLDAKVYVLDLYTDNELFEFWKAYNVHHTAYVCYDRWNALRIAQCSNFAKRFVNEADAAIAGNGHCADLRFGHDSNVGSFLALVATQGCDRPVSENPELHFQGWRYLCMGSNIQFIFYRNSRGEVLVKILRNEEETTIPALESVSGPYYRWRDLRHHILKRAGAIKDVPGFFNDETSVKSQRIKELQSTEADGFYFMTDMHFPANCGYGAALVEELQNNCSPRKVFFGGDFMGNVKNINDGLVPAEKAFLQMSAGQPLYLLRGNHDIKNRTKGNWGQVVKSPYETAKFVRRFTGPQAVFNASDDRSCYFYLDNAKARIRYVIYDTEDADMSVQMKWMEDNAVSTLPAGWKVFILSHKPLKDNPFSSDNLMMCLCGHRHTDLEDAISGIFHIITRADTFDPVYSGKMYKDDKFIPMLAGTKNAQAFDYVSISKDLNTVTMLRIGCGVERVFHIKPLKRMDDIESFRKTGSRIYQFDAGTVEIKKYGDGGNDRYIDAAETGKGDQVILLISADGARRDYFIKKQQN